MTITNIFDAVKDGTFNDFLKLYDGDINQIDKYTQLNLLETAVVNDENPDEKIKIIDYLLMHEIDINFKDSKDKRNALHLVFFCVTRGKKDYLMNITKKLVEAGIDINATDKYNSIPLKYAITVNKLTTEDMSKIYRYLLEKGSKYEQKDSFNKSCIDYANEYSWRKGFMDIVKELKNGK
ncbi:ankyrin repeat domain-containing protein [Lysinibacillus sp. NPDC086135]|uniref:ankyrin repeat domain-containing protein n=1 Tax=Lysinibacillus sp. NPDC086135 TaxID=3364130 RepID=UPI003818EA32